MEALEDERADELKDQIKAECHYVIEPENQILHNGDTLDIGLPEKRLK